MKIAVSGKNEVTHTWNSSINSFRPVSVKHKENARNYERLTRAEPLLCTEGRCGVGRGPGQQRWIERQLPSDIRPPTSH